jgi:hypothetical protein
VVALKYTMIDVRRGQRAEKEQHLVCVVFFLLLVLSTPADATRRRRDITANSTWTEVPQMSAILLELRAHVVRVC